MPRATLDSRSGDPFHSGVEWRPGDILLGLYELLEIGQGSGARPYSEGGMGRVYRARHRTYGMDLAIKVPRSAAVRREPDRSRFEQEAEIWVSLGLHPYVCPCFYVRRIDGIPCLFADYVDGGSLSDWIDDGRLYVGGHARARGRIIRIAAQLAWALAYAHDDHGLVHGDVKPGNVLLAADGTAKLTDFGAARSTAAARTGVGVSGAGRVLTVRALTPAYCSPEQAARRRLTPASDAWSFGATLLEAFVGSPSWRAGPRAPEQLLACRSRSQGRPELPTLPESLALLIGSCFDERPRRRPRLATLADELASLYEDETGDSFGAEPPSAAELLADSRNNQSLTMLDLGRDDSARALLAEALAADPAHLEARANERIVAWLGGEIDDIAAGAALETLDATGESRWRSQYMAALVQIERGEIGRALSLLEAAAAHGGSVQDVAWARTLAASAGSAGCRMTCSGHAGPVSSVAMTVEASLCVSGGVDGTVRVWELPTGACRRVLEGHDGAVTAVAVSDDGRSAISGGDDETVRLWGLDSGRCRRIFEGHNGVVAAVAMSADGRGAVSGGQDATVRVWDVANGRCLRILAGHARAVACVALSRDGRRVLSGSDDGTVRVWERGSGLCTAVLTSHQGPVLSVAFGSAGSVVSGGTDGAVRVWEPETLRCSAVLTGHGSAVTTVAPGSGSIVSGSDDGTLRVWELPSTRCLRTYSDHAGSIAAVVCSPDGRSAVSVGEDGRIRLWDLPSPRLGRSLLQFARPATYAEESESAARARALLTTAEHALDAGRPGEALTAARAARAVPGQERTAWSRATWRRLSSECRRTGLQAAWRARVLSGHEDWIAGVASDSEGRHALSGSDDTTVRLWEVAGGRCLRVLDGHGDRVGAVSFSPQGNEALTGSDDATIRLWDLRNGSCLRTFAGHESRVTAASITPDGRWIVSAGWDRTIRVWERASGRQLRVLSGHDDRITCAHLSADGRGLLSGSDDMTVRLWSLDSGRCRRVLAGDGGWITAVNWVDPRRALSAGDDGALREWSLADGSCLRVLPAHDGHVADVVVSADRRFAVSGGGDGTTQVWDLVGGRCLRVLDRRVDGIGSIALSGDALTLLAGGDDRTVHVWELEWELAAPGEVAGP